MGPGGRRVGQEMIFIKKQIKEIQKSKGNFRKTPFWHLIMK
jgi:hypothetical protein